VESHIRSNGVPYISVDEAKRALFSGNGVKLKTFHFVVYRKQVANWLVYAAPLRPEARKDFLQWESIFGTGFVAVVASRRRDGTLRFRTLAGATVELI